MKKICFITTVSLTMKAFVLETAKYLHQKGGYDITLICNNDEEFAKTYAEKFKDATLAYEDSNSENEIATIDQMVENYMTELGLSSSNVESIKNIVDAFEQGYELNLEGKELADGDFIITGQGVREVAEKEGINPSAWQKFKNFLKGDREKTSNKDTNEIEK